MKTPPRLRRDPTVATESLGRFACGPLPPGLAPYLGGALRRVMIGCLPGPAIVAVSVEAAPHQFAVLPGIRPGVPQLLNRLARVRLIGEASTPTRARLLVHGPGPARAGDLTLPDGLAVANPDELLADVAAGASLDLTATSRPARAMRDGLPSRPTRVPGCRGPFAGSAGAVEEADGELLLEIETWGAPAGRPARRGGAAPPTYRSSCRPTTWRLAGCGLSCPSVVSGARTWGASPTRTMRPTARDRGDIRPAMAGPVGELLAAAPPGAPIRRRDADASWSAAGGGLSRSPVWPRLRVGVPGGGARGDRPVSAPGRLSAEPVPEPIAFPAAPEPDLALNSGGLVEPDLDSWPDDLLAIPKESFRTLAGSGPAPWPLAREFFPICRRMAGGGWTCSRSGYRPPL